ncbi:MAG TPA: hypothetical protein PK583_00470 [Gammaproteobacteria bacterium]|nr:hypothetical protein [Gammaproteobacteria bacterium]HQZ88084.1 hypothetical protein [Gammaproteobacteria bacterium]
MAVVQPPDDEQEQKKDTKAVDPFADEGDAKPAVAVCFPRKQSAEHLDIPFDEYAAEISVLDKRGLITIQSDNLDYVVLN